MTIALCRAMFDHRWPKAPHSLTDGMVATSAAAFAKYGLATPADAADFMAQVSEETGGGTAVEECLDYSAAQALRGVAVALSLAGRRLALRP